jgi:hypothetical protein
MVALPAACGSRNPPSPLMNIAIATIASSCTAATALSSMARASGGVPPCCANAAAESVRADTAPIISVRNIGKLPVLGLGAPQVVRGRINLVWLLDERATKSSLRSLDRRRLYKVGFRSKADSRRQSARAHL